MTSLTLTGSAPWSNACWTSRGRENKSAILILINSPKQTSVKGTLQYAFRAAEIKIAGKVLSKLLIPVNH
jgi:hypothetical protein